MTEYPRGSGPSSYDGWLLKDFYGQANIVQHYTLQILDVAFGLLGLSGRRDMNDVPSGVNAVPLNIVDESGLQDDAAVIAGFFSFKLDNFTIPETFSIVEPAYGWAMFLREDSPFRPPK